LSYVITPLGRLSKLTTLFYPTPLTKGPLSKNPPPPIPELISKAENLSYIICVSGA
jgi:hypothetical protein